MLCAALDVGGALAVAGRLQLLDVQAHVRDECVDDLLALRPGLLVLRDAGSDEYRADGGAVCEGQTGEVLVFDLGGNLQASGGPYLEKKLRGLNYTFLPGTTTMTSVGSRGVPGFGFQWGGSVSSGATCL